MTVKAFPTPDEITRQEIQELTGASLAKVHQISCNINYGFPKRKRLVNRCVVFDRKAVLEWIAKNDLKTLVIKHRVPYKKTNNKQKSFNDMAFNFLCTGKRTEPKKIDENALFNKYKPIKHKVIHLKDVHEQTVLREIDGFAQIHDFNHRIVT